MTCSPTYSCDHARFIAGTVTRHSHGWPHRSAPRSTRAARSRRRSSWAATSTPAGSSASRRGGGRSRSRRWGWGGGLARGGVKDPGDGARAGQVDHAAGEVDLHGRGAAVVARLWLVGLAILRQMARLAVRRVSRRRERRGRGRAPVLFIAPFVGARSGRLGRGWKALRHLGRMVVIPSELLGFWAGGPWQRWHWQLRSCLAGCAGMVGVDIAVVITRRWPMPVESFCAGVGGGVQVLPAGGGRAVPEW